MNIEKEGLLKVEAHLGNLTQRWNPKMSPYIAKKNGKLHILDEQKIIESFSYVKSQIEKMIEENDTTILFVGTTSHLAETVKQVAISCQSPYLVHHWPGGFLTNFRTIQQSINRLKDSIAFQQSDEFATLSKKEKKEIEEEINKSKKIYEGVIDLPKKGWFNYFQGEKRPNFLLFIIGLKKEKTAFKEAKNPKMDIPVIAICNTSDDPDLIDYIIPGNNWKVDSVNYLASAVAKVINESKLRRSAQLSAEKSDISKTKKWTSSGEINSV